MSVFHYILYNTLYNVTYKTTTIQYNVIVLKNCCNSMALVSESNVILKVFIQKSFKNYFLFLYMFLVSRGNLVRAS